jgi:hypothetical protein
MLKSFCGIVALLCFAASVAFAALLTSTPALAPAPVEPAPVAGTRTAPVVFEQGSILVLALAKPAATVARVKAKAYQCGTWEASQVGGAYKRCEWR